MEDREPSQRDVRPVPDPTVLTTEASQRLEGMLRNLIKTELEHAAELNDAKRGIIHQALHDLEIRTAEQKKDTKDALDAALAAQKEQVNTQNISFEKNIAKSDTATAERIKAVETQQATSSKALDDKISDLKDRVIAMEAGRTGVHQSGIDMRAILTSAVGVVAVLIALISLVYALTK